MLIDDALVPELADLMDGVRAFPNRVGTLLMGRSLSQLQAEMILLDDRVAPSMAKGSKALCFRTQHLKLVVVRRFIEIGWLW